MAGQLQTELFMYPRPGGQDLVERICAHATNRPAHHVVAVSVAPTNVAQASDLLFGTGIGVVSTIDHLSTDPHRRGSTQRGQRRHRDCTTTNSP